MGTPREVARGYDGYPGRFESLADPPERVFLEGPWDDAGPRVAIVGSRHATGDGQDVAAWIADRLARSGVAILSGLALGIDAAAHRAALEAGGRSGAVLGTPLDRTYPRAHHELQRRLAGSLGILSEHAPGSHATPGTFASRNRLLAALADAVLVVEGRERSGALITADYARRLGRPLGAVPWDPREIAAAAPLRLIREGATLVRGPADAFALIPPERRGDLALFEEEPGARLDGNGADRTVGLGPIESRLLAALRRHAEPLDAAAARSGLGPREAGAALVTLEIGGLAAREPGGLVRRVGRR
jgi:DNA processing protein